MTLKEIILDVLAKIKGKDIIYYNMKEKSPFYDEMLLCTVDSERQASAAINYLKEDVTSGGFSVRSVEGADTGWVLIDCYDAIVCVFTKEERERIAMEKIFLDVPSEKIELDNLGE